MDRSEMLDYVLDLIEAPRYEQLEYEVALDPVLAEGLALLSRLLDRLLDDGQNIELPTELARKLRQVRPGTRPLPSRAEPSESVDRKPSTVTRRSIDKDKDRNIGAH